jgi:CheY-like chemotaxis protein
MTKKNIWIIDDDNLYQMIITFIIQKTELFSAITSFYDGKQGIDGLIEAAENKEPLPDIILLDINMPIMDGWEFIEEMVKMESIQNKAIRIYIVSSSIASVDKDKAKEYPQISGYFSKPISDANLALIAANDSSINKESH